jgi:hypothetical protein
MVMSGFINMHPADALKPLKIHADNRIPAIFRRLRVTSEAKY